MAETFAAVRERLLAERAALRSELDLLEIENRGQQDDYGVGNHLADNATELFTRERNLAVRHNAEDLLTQVDAALLRLDEGIYGICARCGNEIVPERLEALPYAALCITCQAESERQRM